VVAAEAISVGDLRKINKLFPIAEALHLLEFAELSEGNIKLTAAGRLFTRSDTLSANSCFANTCCVLCHLLLIYVMCWMSAAATRHRASALNMNCRIISMPRLPSAPFVPQSAGADTQSCFSTMTGAEDFS